MKSGIIMKGVIKQTRKQGNKERKNRKKDHHYNGVNFINLMIWDSRICFLSYHI